MPLTHELIKTRQYLQQWETLIDIIDTDSGKRYHQCFCTDTEPAEPMIAPLLQGAKNRIQLELDYEANLLNLTADEEALLEYYRNIKRDVVLRIRQYPQATLQQASDYITGKYPDSLFHFSRLYQQWLRISGCADWDRFKQFVIEHKFRDID